MNELNNSEIQVILAALIDRAGKCKTKSNVSEGNEKKHYETEALKAKNLFNKISNYGVFK